MTVGVCKAHRLDHVSINLCSNNYQKLPKGSIIMSIFAEHFGISIASVKEKVAFGNSCLDLVSIDVYTKFIKISHMFGDLWRFQYFYMVCFGVALVEKVATDKRIGYILSVSVGIC